MAKLVVIAIITAEEGAENAVKEGLAGLVAPTLKEQITKPTNNTITASIPIPVGSQLRGRLSVILETTIDNNA